MDNHDLVTQELDRLKVNLQEIESAKSYVTQVQEISKLLESKIEVILDRVENLASEVTDGFDIPYQSLLTVIAKGETDLNAVFQRFETQNGTMLEANRQRTNLICNELSTMNQEASTFLQEMQGLNFKQRIDALEKGMTEVQGLVNTNIKYVKNGIPKSNKSIRTEIKERSSELESETKELGRRIDSIEKNSQTLTKMTSLFRNTSWGAAALIIGLLIYIAFVK